jgi:hypothetical protein
MQASIPLRRIVDLPIIELVNPREMTRAFFIALGAGIIAALAGMAWLALPLWQASVTAIAIVLPVAVLKWRADYYRYGATVTVLCVLVMAQGFHGVEHLVQWIQYHILGWPSFVSSGLISAADAEWVHFVWNWTVLLTVSWLVNRGMRNVWAWALLAWALAHTFEHSYMMARYLLVLQEFRELGVSGVGAQGLPGILGRDGWLATSPVTQNTFLCRLPGVTTAVRLDVHFWWNVGETILMLFAANTYMGRVRAAREQGQVPAPRKHRPAMGSR